MRSRVANPEFSEHNLKTKKYTCCHLDWLRYGDNYPGSLLVLREFWIPLAQELYYSNWVMSLYSQCSTCDCNSSQHVLNRKKKKISFFPQLRNPQSNKCLDTLGHREGKTVGAYPCHGHGVNQVVIEYCTFIHAMRLSSYRCNWSVTNILLFSGVSLYRFGSNCLRGWSVSRCTQVQPQKSSGNSNLSLHGR